MTSTSLWSSKCPPRRHLLSVHLFILQSLSVAFPTDHPPFVQSTSLRRGQSSGSRTPVSAGPSSGSSSSRVALQALAVGSSSPSSSVHRRRRIEALDDTSDEDVTLVRLSQHRSPRRAGDSRSGSTPFMGPSTPTSSAHRSTISSAQSVRSPSIAASHHGSPPNARRATAGPIEILVSDASGSEEEDEERENDPDFISVCTHVESGTVGAPYADSKFDATSVLISSRCWRTRSGSAVPAHGARAWVPGSDPRPSGQSSPQTDAIERIHRLTLNRLCSAPTRRSTRPHSSPTTG